MDKPSPYFTSLKCRECGRLYPKQAIHVCDFDFGPLEAAYDYDAIRPVLTRQAIESRPHTMWRYRELLPIDGLPREHRADGVVVVSGLQRAEIEVADVDGLLGIKAAALAAFEAGEVGRWFVHKFGLPSRIEWRRRQRF